MSNQNQSTPTMPDPAATIAIVTSNHFDYGPADADCETPTPPGSDFATFVESLLVAHGAKRLGIAVPGEGGWTFDVEMGCKRFRVFVHWAPIGAPPANRWVIQPDICKSLFRSLLGRRTGGHEIEPIIGELRRALDAATEIEKVVWVSRKEFTSIY